MSGPRPPELAVTARQRALLERLARRTSGPQRLVQRARLVLAAADGLNNAEIGRRVGLDVERVRVWRDRWIAVGPDLAAAESGGEDESALPKRIVAVLDDAPRSGAPPTFSAEQICQIVALACEPPEASGRPVTHWTPTELADEAAKRGLVASISPRTVGRFLKMGPTSSRIGAGTG
jgi:putative transposase